MKTAIIIMLISMAVIGIIGLLAFIFVKKSGLSVSGDRTEDPNIKTSQEFVPIEDIRNSMLIMPNHKYRAYMVCSSTNYSLKRPEEQEQVEIAFQSFINSVSFPITFFLQTKMIDNRKRFRQLDETLNATTVQYPGLSEYAESYRKDMQSLGIELQNNHQKKRYIIVSYDEVDELSQLTEEEKIIHASKVLEQRCEQIKRNLDGTGVSSRQLNTAEIIELIYSSFYRDDYSYASVIASKEPFSLIVKGEDKIGQLDKKAVLGQTIKEAITKLETENLYYDEKGREVIKMLRRIEEEIA